MEKMSQHSILVSLAKWIAKLNRDELDNILDEYFGNMDIDTLRDYVRQNEEGRDITHDW